MRRITHSQGSEEWLEWRKGGIGGSDAPIIMGVSRYQTWEELLAHKAAHPNRSRWGRKNQATKTPAQLRGTRLEPLARQLYEERTGNRVPPACGIHDTLNWMRASFDGMTDDGLLIVEIKCVRWQDHQAALDGVVPTMYWPQVQHQLEVAGAPKLHYFSYSEHARYKDTPRRFALVTVKPDRAYIEELIERESAFVKALSERTGRDF